MDTQTLIDNLRNFTPDELEWKLALYNTRKSRDGLELEWLLCKMKGITSWVDTLKTILLEKTTAEKTVADYSPFLPDKENIGALNKVNGLISEQITNIIVDIQNGILCPPEDFISGTAPKPTGYAFYGECKDNEGNITDQILFMRRGNPFMTGSKIRLCISEGNEIVTSERALLKFSPSVDFLLIGGICYFISASIEKDFEMENRHFALAAKRMALIADTDIISDFDQLEAVVMTTKNARKFIDFDRNVLEYIAGLPIIEREEFLSKYGVIIDNNGHMDTSDTQQCELIIDLLCCRSCLDPLGRLSVANGITPRD